jgi:predicted RNA-binding protein YlqC (UPF0109 family)
LKRLLQVVARGLVREPSRVRVTEWVEGGILCMELYVDEDDVGRIIGKGGRTVAALRTLLESVARRRGTRFRLEVVG